MLETFTHFIIALLIGLLVGIEREHSQPNQTRVFGVRAFMLFSFLGTTAASLNQAWMTLCISLFVFCIILLGYYRKTVYRQHRTETRMTTEISAAIVFCLGYMIPTATLLTVTLSALILLVLFERKRLQALARKKFQPHEIETAIILIIVAIGLIPLLPNKTIDPWNLFNPRNFGTLLATIAGIQFAGYVSTQLFGERFGMPITGFLGGLVSSTAVFANLNHALRAHPTFTFSIIASAVFAVLAMLVEIMAIMLVASPSLFYFIAAPILVMGLVNLTIGMSLLYFQQIKREPVTPSLSNPLDLSSIIYTSLFIALSLIIITLAKGFVGNEAVMIISFLGGLFEIHGITLATALLYLNHTLTNTSATDVLYTAIFASFVSKFFLLFTLTPFKFALQTSAFLLAILASGILTYCL